MHVAGLNAINFAGHNDWRLPNVRELQSIVDYQNFSPAVAPAFNACTATPCTVTNCSCTASDVYWSSSTPPGLASNAWSVFFLDGDQSVTPCRPPPFRAIRTRSGVVDAYISVFGQR